MNPKQALLHYKPALSNLLQEDTPDVGRFLRIVVNVLDPCQGYGPGVCSGIEIIVTGCGKTVTFQTATREGVPYGFICPECRAVYPWAFCKGPKAAPSRIVITSHGSTIGNTKCMSDSGVSVIDNGTIVMPGE